MSISASDLQICLKSYTVLWIIYRHVKTSSDVRVHSVHTVKIYAHDWFVCFTRTSKCLHQVDRLSTKMSRFFIIRLNTQILELVPIEVCIKYVHAKRQGLEFVVGFISILQESYGVLCTISKMFSEYSLIKAVSEICKMNVLESNFFSAGKGFIHLNRRIYGAWKSITNFYWDPVIKVNNKMEYGISIVLQMILVLYKKAKLDTKAFSKA